MTLEQPRPGILVTTMTVHELSILVAGARMSLSFMAEDTSGATQEARQALETVLRDFDRALDRVHGQGGSDVN